MVAPSPDENANPCLPFSSAAKAASRQLRVGLPLREYSYPWADDGRVGVDDLTDRVVARGSLLEGGGKGDGRHSSTRVPLVRILSGMDGVGGKVLEAHGVLDTIIPQTRPSYQEIR